MCEATSQYGACRDPERESHPPRPPPLQGADDLKATRATVGGHDAPCWRRVDAIAAAHGLACLGRVQVGELKPTGFFANHWRAGCWLRVPCLWPAASVGERAVQDQERE